MADSRLFLGCTICGKAVYICKLGFDGEAWANPEGREEAHNTMLAELTRHLSGCRVNGQNGVEAAKSSLRVAVEEQCFFSDDHGWLLQTHLSKYGIEEGKRT